MFSGPILIGRGLDHKLLVQLEVRHSDADEPSSITENFASPNPSILPKSNPPYAVLRVQFPLILSGEYDREVTPVPFPNTAVKLSCAHDTWLVTARKNRSSPDFIRAVGSKPMALIFLCRHPAGRLAFLCWTEPRSAGKYGWQRRP